MLFPFSDLWALMPCMFFFLFFEFCTYKLFFHSIEKQKKLGRGSPADSVKKFHLLVYLYMHRKAINFLESALLMVTKGLFGRALAPPKTAPALAPLKKWLLRRSRSRFEKRLAKRLLLFFLNA
jgi:hypothetical protein